MENNNNTKHGAPEILSIVGIVMVLVLLGMAIYNQFISPIDDTSSHTTKSSTSSTTASSNSEDATITSEEASILKEQTKEQENSLDRSNIADVSSTKDQLVECVYTDYTFKIGLGTPSQSDSHPSGDPTTARPEVQTPHTTNITSELGGISLNLQVDPRPNVETANEKYIINASCESGTLGVTYGKAYTISEIDNSEMRYLYQDFFSEKLQNASYEGKEQSGLVWVPFTDTSNSQVSNGVVYMRISKYSNLEEIATLKITIHEKSKGDFQIESVEPIIPTSSPEISEAANRVLEQIGLSPSDVIQATATQIRKPYLLSYKSIETMESVGSMTSEVSSYTAVSLTMANEKSVLVYLNQSNNKPIGYVVFDKALQRQLSSE